MYALTLLAYYKLTVVNHNLMGFIKDYQSYRFSAFHLKETAH